MAGEKPHRALRNDHFGMASGETIEVRGRQMRVKFLARVIHFVEDHYIGLFR